MLLELTLGALVIASANTAGPAPQGAEPLPTADANKPAGPALGPRGLNFDELPPDFVLGNHYEDYATFSPGWTVRATVGDPDYPPKNNPNVIRTDEVTNWIEWNGHVSKLFFYVSVIEEAGTTYQYEVYDAGGGLLDTAEITSGTNAVVSFCSPNIRKLVVTGTGSWATQHALDDLHYMLDSGLDEAGPYCLDFYPYCDGLELSLSKGKITGFWRNVDCAGTDIPVKGKVDDEGVGRVIADNFGWRWGFWIDKPLDCTMEMWRKPVGGGVWELWVEALEYELSTSPCLFGKEGSVSSVMGR